MSAYDKELINSRIIEVCDYYLPGEGQREGQNRQKWYCPVCGGGNFTASTQKQCAGCLSPGCEVPRTKDAVGLIAYFEDLETSGEPFVRCLKKGYEILGIPEPEDDDKPKKRSSKPRSIAPAEGNATAGASASERESSESDSVTISPPEENGSKKATDSPKPSTEQRQQPRFSVGALTAAGASAGSLGLLHSLHHGSSPEEPSPNGSSGQEEEGCAGTVTVEEPYGKDSLTPQQHRELVDRVYRAFLELCPLIERDREFWTSRGVGEEMMQRCGFGSIWRERCWELLPDLERRFGREELTSVPGFYVSEKGRVHTNLYDDYTLIPYYDRDGYITMVQGRVPGTPEKGKPKYKAPVNSGLHLYVPPGYKPEQVMAFVEGAVGAIVAAQNNIPVAAITGYQHYRISGDRGEPDKPLPEHADTDFGKRKVRYIPDEDVKEATRDSVMAEAPKAARALIEAHNGTPYIARIAEGYKDLDEWLLALEPEKRLQKFAELMQSAVSPEQWEGKYATRNGQPQHDGHSEEASQSGQADAVRTGETQTPDGKAGKRSSKSGKVRRSTVRSETGEDGRDQPTEDDHSGEDGADTEELSAPGEDTEEISVQSPSAGPEVRRPEPQPRTYKKVAQTNIGEFMVALFCGLIAGLGFLLLVVIAAPAWGPTTSLAEVPVRILMILALFIIAVVVFYVCRKLYLRRCIAIRKHLAGQR